MRGVSSVIVIILVLFIAVAMAATAYFWLFETVDVITTEGEKRIAQVGTMYESSMAIETVSGDRMYIRNTGLNNITDIVVYVDDALISTLTPVVLEPSEVEVITFSTPLVEDTYLIRVTGAYAEIEGEYIIEVEEPPPEVFISVCKSGGCDSTTVQGGLNLAVVGDTVRITDDLTYNENSITFPDNSITLDCAEATINGVLSQNGINMNARSNLVIGNCTFNQHNRAIQITGGSSNVIKNNTLTSSVSIGVFLQSSASNNEISENTIINTAWGIVALNSPSNDFFGNNIEGVSLGGIYVNSFGVTNITNNRVCNSGFSDIFCSSSQTGTGNTATDVTCRGVGYLPC